MAESTNIILNPEARFRAVGRAWQSCRRECMRELAPVEITVVKDCAEAEAATRRGAMRGFEKIVAVGDTETAHGVLNGFMALAEEHRNRIKVGFLSVTRPQPWCRTLELPRGLRRQLEILRAGNTLPLDVGRVTARDPEGRPMIRHFLNGAGFGLVSQLRHDWRGGAGDLFLGIGSVARTLAGAWAPRSGSIALAGDDGPIHRGPWVAGLVMVGRYYPGFGKVAPEADPRDGVLDFVGAPGPLRIGGLLRLLAGWGPGGSGIVRAHGATFTASIGEEPVYLEVDGLAAGMLPATFGVVPRALPVIVASVPAMVMRPKFGRLPKVDRGGLTAESLKVGSER